jgi:hypothetical protein
MNMKKCVVFYESKWYGNNNKRSSFIQSLKGLDIINADAKRDCNSCYQNA